MRTDTDTLAVGQPLQSSCLAGGPLNPWPVELSFEKHLGVFDAK